MSRENDGGKKGVKKKLRISKLESKSYLKSSNLIQHIALRNLLLAFGGSQTR